VLDGLRLIQDRVVEAQALEELDVTSQERVAGDDDVDLAELVLLVLALRAMPQGYGEGRGEAADLPMPVRHDGGRRDDERPQRLLLLLVLQGEQQSDRL